MFFFLDKATYLMLSSYSTENRFVHMEMTLPPSSAWARQTPFFLSFIFLFLLVVVVGPRYSIDKFRLDGIFFFSLIPCSRVFFALLSRPCHDDAAAAAEQAVNG